ncbi:hypothetical protein P154DRAFT_575392 [Amniculicola lignicola CBS 123094]|uniref:MARVEL domain-containing protein n=1 Tax=Amniculicola lignicola CBS 123094 TaxID=1392246 RepID=A0A6A5WJM8_9PLEO|nr:hypothetical protein P154DRAFT_575392 [Amniculicola lignicola CBS 123094]
MARTVVGSALVVREKYFWPDAQLNVWTIVMLATGGTILGINAQFLVIQDHLRLRSPWIFPYGITVGSLTVVFILLQLVLIAQRRLLPGIMMLSSFILFVLFMAGVIGTSMQLFSGPNVNNLCNQWVNNGNLHQGQTIQTLGWLQQQNICQCWSAQFAFWIIGTVFLVWMMIMASQVNQNQYE